MRQPPLAEATLTDEPPAALGVLHTLRLRPRRRFALVIRARVRNGDEDRGARNERQESSAAERRRHGPPPGADTPPSEVLLSMKTAHPACMGVAVLYRRRSRRNAR